MATHLQELVRLPHPRRQALERDVHGWDRVAPEELRFVAFKHAERNAEQDVKSIEEQNVPHAEKRLKKTPHVTASKCHTLWVGHVPRRGGSQ